MSDLKVDPRTKSGTALAAGHCICGVLIRLNLINEREYRRLCRNIAKRGDE